MRNVTNTDCKQICSSHCLLWHDLCMPDHLIHPPLGAVLVKGFTMWHYFGSSLGKHTDSYQSSVDFTEGRVVRKIFRELTGTISVLDSLFFGAHPRIPLATASQQFSDHFTTLGFICDSSDSAWWLEEFCPTQPLFKQVLRESREQEWELFSKGLPVGPEPSEDREDAGGTSQVET